MKRIDLAGHRFGRLTAVRIVETEKRGTYWLCRCDCGEMTEVFIGHLRSGKIQSCGCLAKDAHKKHGLSRTPEHIAWCAMRNRCLSDKTNGYESYGGAGIKICARWGDFEKFLEDMGTKPTPEHTLDRIDPFGDYTPENCRWADKREQSRNQKKSKRWLVDGVEYETAGDAAIAAGVPRHIVRDWCHAGKNGWSVKGKYEK